MTIEITASQPSLAVLATDEAQNELINFVVDSYKRGRQDRGKIEEEWLKNWKAYLLHKNNTLYKKAPWRSSTVMPWAFESVETAIDEFTEILFPDENKFFEFHAVNKQDAVQQRNAKVMTEYITKLFEDMDFITKYRQHLKQKAIVGCSAVKIYWKTASRVLPNGAQVIDYDAPFMEVINMQDFVIFPATHNIDEAVVTHRIWRPVDKVKNNELYRNTEELQPFDRVGQGRDPESDIHRQINEILGVSDQFSKQDNMVELLEAWGDFVIDGQRFSNYVVTVANRNTLIRFQPNPHLDGSKPFHFSNYRDTVGTVYSMGLIKPIRDYNDMGTTMSNMMFDEAKLKIHGLYKYEPDGIFNPDEFIAKPGGCFPVGDIQNVQALNPNINLNFGFAEVNQLNAMVEEVTGVTQFSKGASSTSKTRTAREAVLLNRAGNKKFLARAKHFDRTDLVPIVKHMYSLVQMFDEPINIVDYVGGNVLEIASILPLKKVRTRVTGLATSLERATKIETIERMVSVLASTPAAPMINWIEMAKEYTRCAGMDDSDRFLLPEVLLDIINQLLVAGTTGIPGQLVNGAFVQQQATRVPPRLGDEPQQNEINQGVNPFQGVNIDGGGNNGI